MGDYSAGIQLSILTMILKQIQKLLSLDREEAILLATAATGILSVGLLAIYVSGTKLTSSKPSEMLQGDGESASEAESKSAWQGSAGSESGIYSLGKMLMALGTRDQFIESAVDLEYNGYKVTFYSDGRIKDEAGANSYFKGKEGRLKDAIIRGASDFSAIDFSDQEGYERFKERLVTALNINMSAPQLFTNVYFKKFMLYPGDNAPHPQESSTEN